jgi:hypothetical protein
VAGAGVAVGAFGADVAVAGADVAVRAFGAGVAVVGAAGPAGAAIS